MADRNSSGLSGPAVIITLLAALGIGGTLRRSPTPATPATTAGGIASVATASPATTAGHEANGGYEYGAGYLLAKFFATVVDKNENKKAWATHTEPNSPRQTLAPFGGEFPGGDPRADYSVRFLIATLPTPISPPLQYLFDSELDALQLAAGTAGYSLDSFNLPWTTGAKDSSGKFQLGGEIDIASVEPKTNDSPARNAGKPGHHAERKGRGRNEALPDETSPDSYTVTPNSDSDSRWKRDSGVILFRHDHQLLVVFVVGEAPTYGVNQIALRDALDQITWLEGWQIPEGGREPAPYLVRAVHRENLPNQIRIIGPSFSGSADSFRNTLEEWRRSSGAKPNAPGDLSIRIISGTATAVDDDALMPRRRGDENSALPPLTFYTVQIPDPILWGQIPAILEDIADVTRTAPSPAPAHTPSATADYERPHIALLLEDTSYGRGGRGQEKGLLKMSFPLHISELRAANSNQSTSTLGPNLGRQDLALPDEAGQQRRDVIESFSPRAAVYDQLVLNNLLTTIKRDHIRYVGIVATDVEDLIFLVQQIRIFCPDTVVFTTSADIGFLHTDVNNDLLGLLIFTTYPLLNRLQDWTFPFKGEIAPQTFSSDLAHGVYNATLAQLDLSGKMLDYGEPFVRQPSTPVIQIGVVGRDDIWPLAFQLPIVSYPHHLLPPTDSAVPKSTAEPSLDPPAQTSTSPIPIGDIYPRPFEFVFFVMNLIFLVCAAPALLSHRRREQLVGSRWWLDALLLESRQTGLVEQRCLYLMFFSMGMLLAEIVGLGFALLPVAVAYQNDSGWSLLESASSQVGPARLLTFGFEFFIALLVLAAAARSIFQMFKDRNLWSALFWAFISALLASISLWFVTHQWDRDSSVFSLYTFLRAAHLRSGVSPLMALMFLGLAALALLAGNLSRVAMLTDRPLPPLRADGNHCTMFGHGSFRGVSRLWKWIVDDLEQSELQLRGAHFLIVVLVVAFFYFWLGKVRLASSVDGWQFDTLFILLGFGVYVMFSLVLLRFVLIWIALRHLLRRLYSHPSRYAYKNVQLAPRPSHLEHQKLHLYEARPGLSAVEYELGCVRAIIRIAGQVQEQSGASLAPPQSELSDDISNNPLLKPTLETAEKQLEELWRPTDWRSNLAARSKLYDTMAELAGIVTALFEPAWRMSAHTPPLQMVLTSDDDKLTIDGKLRQQAELFVAARVGDFVRHVFPHLMNLVGFAMPAVLGMMLAVSAYPFPAHDTLLWVGWTVLLTTIVISLYVFIGINRDPILSMFSGTDPGQFNWDSTFTMHLVLFAVIPILALLGAQFPHALVGAFSWIGSIFGGGGTS
jgi:hypothetical protein